MRTIHRTPAQTAVTTFRSPDPGRQELGDPTETAIPFFELHKILVPIDFSETSLKALEYAAAFATRFKARIILLHVVGPATYVQELSYIGIHEAEQCERAVRQLQTVIERNIPAGLEVEPVVSVGIVFDVIVETGKKTGADLIVAATHGYGGIKHATTGSTVERIVRHATCPVLVVRGNEP